jgi:regulator of protease activity HflC (stomatin/prohibitin superfamily)
MTFVYIGIAVVTLLSVFLAVFLTLRNQSRKVQAEDWARVARDRRDHSQSASTDLPLNSSTSPSPSPAPSGGNGGNVTRHHRMNYLAFTALIILSVVMLVTALWALRILYGYLFSSWETDTVWMRGVYVIVYGLFAGWFAWSVRSSFGEVQENQLAFLMLFGRFVCDLQPGLFFCPPLICSVFDVQTEQVDIDIPDDPNFIDHSDPNVDPEGKAKEGTVKKGFTPALRINTGQRIAREDTFQVVYVVRKIDGTSEEITAGSIPRGDSQLNKQALEIEATVSFFVEDALALYRRIGNIDNAKRVMFDHAKAGLTAEIGRLCPGEVIKLTKEIGLNIKYELYLLSREWGIRIMFVRITQPTFSHEYNKRVSAAAGAIEGRNARTLEGEGEGAFQRNQLTGMAEGQRKLIEASMLDGGRTQAIQAFSEAMGNAQLWLADPSNPMAPAAAIGKALGMFASQAGQTNTQTPIQPTTPPQSERGNTRDERRRRKKRNK